MAYTVLDISRYNPISDYSAAAGDIDGVLIRAGYRGYGSSGTLATDNLFTTHYNGFFGKGIKIGFYWFTQAISKAEGVEEANYVHSLINGKTCDFPVYIDSEYSNTNHDGRADGLSASARTDYLIAFCDRMIELGYRAGVYASDSWYTNQLELSRIQAKGYSLWVARYSSNPPENVSNYDAWQYTSSGSISGYSGKVDLSHFYNDVAGWGGGSTPTGKDIATMNFTVEPTEVNFHNGPNEPTVTVKDSVGNVLVLSVDYDKEYQDNVNVGTGKIIITGKGNFTGSKTLEFTINPLDITPGASIDVGSPDSDGCYSLDNIVVSCMGIPMEENKDYTISIDEYEEDGYVKAKVTATAIEGSNFTGYYYERFPIEKLPTTIDISNFTIELYDTSFDYSGEEIEPFVNLLDEDESVVSESEFTVDYENNINAGIAKVIVTAKDINYSGTVSTEFTINPLSISGAEVTCGNYDVDGCYNLENLRVSLGETVLEKDQDYTTDITESEEDGYIKSNIQITGKNNYKDTINASFNTERIRVDLSNYKVEITDSTSSYIYNGLEFKPTIQISNPDEESEILQLDRDYTIEYSDNIDAGEAHILITGIDNYTGSIDFTFTIEAASIEEATVTCGEPDEDACFDLNNLEVKLGETVLEKDKDYQIEVSERTEEGFKISTVQITGINNYKDTISEEFKTEKIRIDISSYIATIVDDVSDLYYNGQFHTPEVFVSSESEQLIKDQDYEVDYENNMDAGEASIIITGINDYTGQITLNFTIKKVSLEEATITCGEPDENECYDLSNLQVVANGRTLIKDTDYTVITFETEDEIELEVLTTVTVNGKNNYEGSKTVVYRTEVIDPFAIDINDLEISIDADDENPFIYNGSEFKPTVTIKDEDEVLEEEKDYTVIYRNNINAGTGFVDISGKGSYRGNKTMMFTIAPCDFSETVEITCGEADEDGYYDLDNLEVKNGDIVLKEITDYTIDIQSTELEQYIENNITVSGENNYKGEKTVTFNSAKELFSPTDISTFDLVLNQTTYIFSGEAFEPETKVSKDDLVLERDTDYEVEYQDNRDAGTAKVIVTAKGEEYIGSLEGEFTIEPKDLSSGTITCGAADEEGCYDITQLKVTVDNIDLERNVDYSYEITTERVDYTIISTVTVTGKDNYKGELSAKFKTSNIVIDVNDVDISLDSTEFIYTSEVIVPEIITELEYGVDYETEYQESVNYGTYVVIIRGIGNYTGTRELEYTILRRDIADAEVTCGEPSSEGIYDINNLKVVVDERELTPSEDYQFTTSEVEAEDGFHKTICYIYGINNYTGSIQKEFITSRDQIYPGKTIELELCTVYPRFGSRKSSTKKTGTFYLWDNKVVNNRIRLTSNPDGIGKLGYLTGWVDVENVITRTDIRIGDKVLVNGKINTYADGSGNTMNKTNIIMYIVDILDPEEFQYNYGVASDINRARQGWATADMIQRVDE